MDLRPSTAFPESYCFYLKMKIKVTRYYDSEMYNLTDSQFTTLPATLNGIRKYFSGKEIFMRNINTADNHSRVNEMLEEYYRKEKLT